jgi:hypothetical protein
MPARQAKIAAIKIVNEKGEIVFSSQRVAMKMP